MDIFIVIRNHFLIYIYIYSQSIGCVAFLFSSLSTLLKSLSLIKLLIKRSAKAGCPLVLYYSIPSPSMYSFEISTCYRSLITCLNDFWFCSNVLETFHCSSHYIRRVLLFIGTTTAYLLKTSIITSPALNLCFASISSEYIKHISN